MPYLGTGPIYGDLPVKTFTGDGSATTFALDHSVPSDASIIVSIDGVRQHVGSYNAAGGTTLDFLSVAPASGTSIEVVHLGIEASLNTPADLSVTNAKIVDATIAAGKLASTLDLSSKTLTIPASAVTEAMVTAHVTATDTSVIENNIAMLAFKVASGDSLTKFSMVDQVVDDFADSTGIDTGNSTSVLRQSGYVTGGSADADLKLLLHFDEAANNATTITPSVGPGDFTAGNNAKVSNGSAKFGTMAGRFQSSTNQYIGAVSHADFDFGTGDFTIDFWCEFNGTGLGNGSSNSLLQVGVSSNQDHWSVQANAGTLLLFRIKDAGGTVYSTSASHTWTTTAGTWTHVAVTRDSGKVYLFINGTLLNAGGTTFAHDIKAAGTSSELRLATDSAGDWDTNFDGYMDEIRIRKGSASWTSGFSIPTSAYGTTTTGADLTLVSTSTTAEATATTGDLVLLIEDLQGTASLGTDIKGYISRNGNANYSTAVTWVDEGDWGTNKRIITARGVALGALAGTTDMRYKITTHNQSAGSKETLVHAVSLGWS